MGGKRKGELKPRRGLRDGGKKKEKESKWTMNGSQEGKVHGLDTILNVFFLQTRSRICSHRSKKKLPPI